MDTYTDLINSNESDSSICRNIKVGDAALSIEDFFHDGMFTNRVFSVSHDDYDYSETFNQDGVLDKMQYGWFGPEHEINSNDLKIAVVGDVHGKLSLALSLLEEWENHSQHTLDYIIQVGDIGAFPTNKMDATTKNMAKKHPEELGFRDFMFPSEVGDYFFGKEGVFKNTPFYFVSGNHENHNFLKDNISHSVYENVIFLPDGEVVSLRKNNFATRIGGLGFEDEKTVSKTAARNLSKKDVDVFLTHMPPGDYSENSRIVRDLISTSHARFAFNGHNYQLGRNPVIGETQNYSLNEINIRGKRLVRNSLGLLTVGDSSQFSYLTPFWRGNN